MALVPVNGTKLYRDTETMALINKDVSGAQEYQARRKFAENQKSQINNVKMEIDNIKNDISDIKKLMIKLIEKG
jgi:wobble nucleotide-excising tRNase